MNYFYHIFSCFQLARDFSNAFYTSFPGICQEISKSFYQSLMGFIIVPNLKVFADLEQVN